MTSFSGATEAPSAREIAPVVAIVQARMTSTRLPGKVLMDIAGRPALAMMLGRVRRARFIDRIVVATTVNATDDPIVSLCGRLETAVFRGDEHDVIGRFVAAAARYDACTIVRLTADCPFADPAVIDGAIAMYRDGDWDYVGNAGRRSLPDGLDVEVFSRAALERSARSTAHPLVREHVTVQLRGVRSDVLPDGGFRRANYELPADFSHIRWTLDRDDDLARLRRLAARLPENFSWLQALAEATKEPALLGPQGTAPS